MRGKTSDTPRLNEPLRFTNPVQPPAAAFCCWRVAEQPETIALHILDPVIIALQADLFIATPPLAQSFSVADNLMADVLRLLDRFGGLAKYPACQKYLAYALARPAFKKVHADQLAFFAEADQRHPN